MGDKCGVRDVTFLFDPCTRCACQECLIAADAFNRPPSADVGPLWAILSGSWFVGGGGLTTNNPNARIRFLPTNTREDEHVVEALLLGTMAGDQLRVFVGVVADEDAWYAQVEFARTFSTLTLWRRTAAGDSLLDTRRIFGIVAGDRMFLRVCFGPRFLRADAADAAANVIITAAYEAGPPGSSVTRLGTGNLFGVAEFRVMRLQRHGSAAGQCRSCSLECAACEDGVLPAVLAADIEAFRNGVADECEPLNRRYILDPFLVPDGAPSSCNRFFRFNPDVGKRCVNPLGDPGITQLQAQVFHEPEPDIGTLLLFFQMGCTTTPVTPPFPPIVPSECSGLDIVWLYSQPGRIDCQSIRNLDVPFDSAVSSVDLPGCCLPTAAPRARLTAL